MRPPSSNTFAPSLRARSLYCSTFSTAPRWMTGPVKLASSSGGLAGRGRPLHEVDRPRREAGLREQFDEPLADGGRVLRRLEDRRVAFEQARPEHPQGHREREVPRRDDADDAPGLAAHVRI